jgi:hypothetical protein
VPDTYYFIWENSRFQQIAHVQADTAPSPFTPAGAGSAPSTKQSPRR